MFTLEGTVEGEPVSVDASNIDVEVERGGGEDPPIMVLIKQPRPQPLQGIAIGPVSRLEDGATYTVRSHDGELNADEIEFGVSSKVFVDLYDYQFEYAFSTGGEVTIEFLNDDYVRGSFDVSTDSFSVRGEFDVERTW